jgi:hypothetical protein
MSSEERADFLSKKSKSEIIAFFMEVIQTYDQRVSRVEASAKDNLAYVRRGYEDESMRCNEMSGKLSDEVNRLKNELEEAHKVISALIKARNAHVAVGIFANAAAMADIEVVRLGVHFNMEDIG